MGVLTQIWEAIPVYTGLSSVTFCTLVAVLIAGYYLLSSLFAPQQEFKYVPMEPPPPPVQIGTITEEELRAYDGTDPEKPLLMAIKAQIYDVSRGRAFYGPGGMYALFAGKDASRALAKMSFEEKDLTGDIEGLSMYEMDALNDWEFRFMSKYPKVGQIAKPEGGSGGEQAREIPVTDASNEESEKETKEEPKLEAEDLPLVKPEGATGGEQARKIPVTEASNEGSQKETKEEAKVSGEDLLSVDAEAKKWGSFGACFIG
ncbi:hypothetical protein R1sor_017936 [Riccia sorocarpa]|uniref:Cytochrome b5 heme-binding domain-containing protein n=1 Tax=Riccia sorocarpa TaxID=122646 RepID=A0ABD3IBJ8_9MARC